MSARAWIDPITNVIRPRGVILRRDLRGFLTGPWPAYTIQPFIHELTHHWCFHSAVGLAVALLRFRALRRPAMSNREAAPLLFDEMLTVDTMLELIRPISEGLALFAEYDMAPGASPIVTTPLAWTSIAMSARSALMDLSQPQAAQELTNWLLNLRLSPDSLSRKMDFLSRPLTALDSAYFDGYMVVKRLYLDLSQSVPTFADTDLFLSYLRSYLFEDYGMVAILADRDCNTFRRQIAMIERLGTRLAELYRPNLEEDVATFERFNNREPNGDRSAGIPGLGLGAKELEDGLRIQQSLLSELQDNPEAEQTMRKLLDVQRLWLSRRSLAYVASEPAKVQVLNGMVSAWPDPADYEFPLLTGVSALPGTANTEGKESGWVSLILQPQTGIFASVVGVGARAAAIHWPPAIAGPGPEIVALFSDPECSPVVVQEQHESIKAWVDSYFREAPEPMKTWIAETRQSTQSALKRIADVFLGRWGENREVAVRCLRSTNRLWDLFDRDRKMFETFVALGLLRNFDVLLPSFTAALSNQGWDTGRALRFAIQIQAKGVSLVRNDEGIFRWLI
ncbi:MAG TPA: hypothetical protein VF283_04370 [Bryobacteraceae bacterium]